MPKPSAGEIWLVRFPFSDLTTTKLRPALVVATHGEDIIVVGMFSRVPDNLRPTWVLVEDQHCGSGQTGLKKSSVLKAERLRSFMNRYFKGGWESCHRIYLARRMKR